MKDFKIYNSKGANIFWIIFLGTMIILGIYALLFEINGVFNYAIFLIMIIYSFYEFLSYLKKIKDKNVKIKLSSDGITTAVIGFLNWSEIENEIVKYKYGGGGTHYYLFFRSKNYGEVLIHLNDLSVKAKKMEELLKKYRNEYERKCKMNY